MEHSTSRLDSAGCEHRSVGEASQEITADLDPTDRNQKLSKKSPEIDLQVTAV
jgi:hypothetical protein